VGRLFSPTLNAAETELLYAADGEGSSLRYYRSTRASKSDVFESSEPIPELDAACASTDDRTIDVTGDGLRAYLVCYGPDNPESNVLRFAVRAALDAPFVLDEKSYGVVGPSAAIASGELTLYSSGLTPSADPPLLFERTTTSEPFDAGTVIPGLEGTLLITPDVSADGLSLFGNQGGAISVATRASVHDAFSLPEVIIPAPESGDWVSVTVSENCRSLYAVMMASSEPRTVQVFER
jgi:hypothetical protein